MWSAGWAALEGAELLQGMHPRNCLCTLDCCLIYWRRIFGEATSCRRVDSVAGVEGRYWWLVCWVRGECGFVPRCLVLDKRVFLVLCPKT